MANKGQRKLLCDMWKADKKVSKNKVKKIQGDNTVDKGNLTSQNLPTRLEATKLIGGFIPLSIIKCRRCQVDMEQTHPCHRVCHQCRKEKARISSRQWRDSNKEEVKRKRSTQRKPCKRCDSQIRLHKTFCDDCKVVRLEERTIINEKRRRYKTMFKNHMTSILFR